ncbi:MAG TPA: hypothetical protein VET88_16285, partial [Gammaproteobacteria bacterium]|nr:hypothetical protein [Gammaproteobacteria bacterium]
RGSPAALTGLLAAAPDKQIRCASVLFEDEAQGRAVAGSPPATRSGQLRYTCRRNSGSTPAG